MADKFQTTFIPKGNNAPSQKTISSKKKVASIVTLVTFLVFALSAAMSGYVLINQRITQANIESITLELTKVRESVDDGTIQQIADISDRIRLASDLLDNHLAPSEIFVLLETYTLPTIGFQQFSYDYAEGSFVRISGQGVAAGYGSVVRQSDTYTAADNFSDVVFSNLLRNIDGTVNFTFEAKLKKKPILFQESMKNDGANVPLRSNSETN